jgi:hypothetical protein
MNVDRILATLNGHQGVFCMTSPQGSVDVFLAVRGLPSWRECRARAQRSATQAGSAFYGLSGEDMLTAETSLPEGEQNPERIRMLRKSLHGDHP